MLRIEICPEFPENLESLRVKKGGEMGWQVTAKGIHCDLVDEGTSLLVHKDGTIICTYYRRYSKEKNQAKKLKSCLTPEKCPRVSEFRDWALSN